MYIEILLQNFLRVFQLLKAENNTGVHFQNYLEGILNIRVHYRQPGYQCSQFSSKRRIIVVIHLQVFSLLLLLDRFAWPSLVVIIRIWTFLKLVLGSWPITTTTTSTTATTTTSTISVTTPTTAIAASCIALSLLFFLLLNFLKLFLFLFKLLFEFFDCLLVFLFSIIFKPLFLLLYLLNTIIQVFRSNWWIHVNPTEFLDNDKINIEFIFVLGNSFLFFSFLLFPSDLNSSLGFSFCLACLSFDFALFKLLFYFLSILFR